MLNNQKKLLIALVVITATYFAVKWANSGTNERTLASSLFELDTANVSKVRLFPKSGQHEEIIFTKNVNNWSVAKGSITSTISDGRMKSMLNELSMVKPQRLAGRSEKQWEKYHVNDSLGTRVIVETADNKKMVDLVVGKFSFRQSPQQQQFQRGGGKSLTYVRNSQDTETYATEGFLGATFDRDFNAFRDKSILKVTSGSVRNISMSSPAGKFDLLKGLDGWSIEGIEADSAKVAQYLSQITNINGKDIDDSFVASGPPTYEVNFKGDNMSDQQVLCYELGSQFKIQSSLNAGVTFTSDSSGIFSRLFKGKEHFLGNNQ